MGVNLRVTDHASKDSWLTDVNRLLHYEALCIFANPLLITILMQHQVWWHFTTLFTYHYYCRAVSQICSVVCTNLLLCIILLPDPSLANSIHVQRWPTHVLLLPDHDGWGNWHCLCSKIQSVSNSHTVCNLLKIDNHTLSANSLLMIFGIGNVIIAYVEQSNSVWAHLERSHVI